MTFSGTEVIGLEDIEEMFKKILPRHSKNIMRATVHGVASMIAKDAESMAPEDEGDLKRAIKAKRRKSPPLKPRSDVWVTHGKNAKIDAFYWRFQEYGTSGKNPIPAKHFFKKAKANFEANKESYFRQQFGEKLEKAATRAAKKRLK